MRTMAVMALALVAWVYKQLANMIYLQAQNCEDSLVCMQNREMAVYLKEPHEHAAVVLFLAVVASAYLDIAGTALFSVVVSVTEGIVL